MLILAALQDGIASVLVVGCELGNCHYRHGNCLAENRTAVLKSVLAASGDGSRVTFAHIPRARRGSLIGLVEQVKLGMKSIGAKDAEGSPLRFDARSGPDLGAGPGAATPAAILPAAHLEAMQ